MMLTMETIMNIFTKIKLATQVALWGFIKEGSREIDRRKQKEHDARIKNDPNYLNEIAKMKFPDMNVMMVRSLVDHERKLKKSRL